MKNSLQWYAYSGYKIEVGMRSRDNSTNNAWRLLTQTHFYGSHTPEPSLDTLHI